MKEKNLLHNYKYKKYSIIIDSLKNEWSKKKYNEKQKIFYVNLLACCYVNLNKIKEALVAYKKANKFINKFDGPEVKYNLGILPDNIKLVDLRINSFFRNELKKKLKIKTEKLEDLINSLKIDPNIKGACHSNLGLTLINLNKIFNKIKNKKTLPDDIFYLNQKYNSYRAEILLKNKKITLFKKEVKKILKYNPINMRLFSLLSFAMQKYRIKNINYFCSNPLEYVKEFDLLKKGVLNLKFIKKINKFINDTKNYDSFEPGSIFLGYKSVGNLFDSKNKSIIKLKNIFKDKIKEYINFYKLKNDNYIKKFPQKNILKGWYIRLKKGGGIDYHIHNSWLSAVFYLSLPIQNNGGTLDLSIINWNFKKEKKFSKSIIPTIGKLVIFPSSLPHRVSKFKKNKFRISIAFDVIPT